MAHNVYYFNKIYSPYEANLINLEQSSELITD